MNIDIEATIDALKGEHNTFDLVVKESEVKSIAGLPRVRINFFYLKFVDGKCSRDLLAVVLKDNIVRYCLPRADRISVLKKIKDEPTKQLAADEFMKARRLFQSAKKTQKKAGEPGEILLYLFLECFRDAPQIMSKMYLKTAKEMPIHGSDGVHIKWDATHGEMVTYFGESKLFISFRKAIKSPIQSLAETLLDPERKTREIDIITDFSDFGHLSAGDKEYIKTFLNPYVVTNNTFKRREVCAIFLGYNSGCMPDPKKVFKDAEADFAAHCPHLYAWMAERYSPAATFGTVRIWLRNDVLARDR